MCDCRGGIQDESHVLFTCIKTDSARRRFEIRAEDFGCIGEMMDMLDVQKLVPYVYNCMKSSGFLNHRMDFVGRAYIFLADTTTRLLS